MENKQFFQNLKKVYLLSGYDIGVVNEEEFNIFKKHSIDFPKNWFHLNKNINFFLLKKKIVIIVLPTIKKKNIKIFSKKLSSFYHKIKYKYKNIPIIVISALGYYMEKELLNNVKEIEILFGSGDGPGFSGELVNNQSTLWVRPYSKGKAVNYVDIKDYVSFLKTKKWIYKKNIYWKVFGLGDDIKDDQMIKDIVKRMR